MRIKFLALTAVAVFCAALALFPLAGASAAGAVSSAQSPRLAAQTPTTLDPSQVANKGDVHDATVDGVIGIIEGSAAILLAGAALIILYLRRPSRRSAA